MNEWRETSGVRGRKTERVGEERREKKREGEGKGEGRRVEEKPSDS